MKITHTLTAIACAALAMACGGAIGSSNGNANQANASTNTATPLPSPIATPAESPLAESNTTKYDPAKSPTDAYKAAYYARKSCDVPALKKLFTKDVIAFMTDIGSDDKKTLDDMIKDMCSKPQAPTDESRHEKIDGNHATLEYPDDTGNWRTMDLIKEDGSWKLDLPGPPKKK